MGVTGEILLEPGDHLGAHFGGFGVTPHLILKPSGFNLLRVNYLNYAIVRRPTKTFEIHFSRTAYF